MARVLRVSVIPISMRSWLLLGQLSSPLKLMPANRLPIVLSAMLNLCSKSTTPSLCACAGVSKEAYHQETSVDRHKHRQSLLSIGMRKKTFVFDIACCLLPINHSLWIDAIQELGSHQPTMRP